MCPSISLSTTNYTWTGLGLNSGLCSESWKLTTWAMAQPYTCAAYQRVCKSSAFALCVVYDADARIVINLDAFSVAPNTNRTTIYKYMKII